MGRPERPLDKTNGRIAAFAHDLRLLRSRAGNPSYRELARTALFAPSVLSSAASGHRLPTLAVTLAFVTACRGDRAAWERRWRGIAGQPDGVPPGRAPDTRIELDAQSNGIQSNGIDSNGAHANGVHYSAVLSGSALDAGLEQMGKPDTGLPVARPAQLPMGSTNFVGRSRALTDAVRLIGAGGDTRTPMLVSGPIGVGKTAFALRLADEVARHFPDGELFADLGDDGKQNQQGTSNSTNSIVRGFLRALGVPAHLVPDDPTQRIGLYRSLLAERRMFVLLANVRDEWQVRPLLAGTAHSQVVMTSRARLLGLDDVHRLEMDPFTRAESLTLIGRLAGTARVHAEYEATDAIAELCGDLPLAVNIIGRKIAARQEWTIAYTAGQLADRDRLLVNLSVGDVTVRDRLASAYQRLTPRGRLAVQYLGGNGAGWTTAIEVAAAMSVRVELADELLESLVDAGLLTRATVAGRYSVSKLVSVFASAVRLNGVVSSVALIDRRARRSVVGQVRRGTT